MSLHSEAVAERIRLAMLANSPNEIIDGVKSAISQEVKDLNPEANVVLTSYFNHSYMPDIVVHWTDGRQETERPIFLRSRFTPRETARDIVMLASHEPVVVALSAPEREDPVDALRVQTSRADRVLVTDAESLAEVASGGSQNKTRQPNALAPLRELVRTNLLRSGQGLLMGETASAIATGGPQDQEASSDEVAISMFIDSTIGLFAPEATLQLRRAAEILRIGLLASDDEAVGQLTSGQLSDRELRVIVPHLLSDERSRNKSNLWRSISEMIDLQQLEDMWESLQGLDASPLIDAGVQTWRAKRAQVVLNNSFESDAQDSDAPHWVAEEDPTEFDTTGQDPNGPLWSIANRMLVGNAGPARLLIATDARRLRGRKDSQLANWDDLSALLDDLALESIELLGAARRINVSAEESANIRRDIEAIRGSLRDNFFVREFTARDPSDAEGPSLSINFAEMTVTANQAPLTSLIRAAAVLGYRETTEILRLLPDRSNPANSDSSDD